MRYFLYKQTVNMPAMFIFFIALAIISNSRSVSASFSVDDLQDLFAKKFCIEGVLESLPGGPAIITSGSQQEALKPVSTVTATENEQPTPQRSLPTTQNSKNINLPTSTKNKTPKSLIEELARLNNIQYQYQLIDEEGSPHNKIFTVMLQLGNEVYEAEGATIKQAEHSAAVEALASTQFQLPPQNTDKNEAMDMLTPTVELNTLAKKLGESVTYMLGDNTDSEETEHNHKSWSEHYMDSNQIQQNFTYDPSHGFGHQGDIFKVLLQVGQRAFSGEGDSEQDAKHNAASKALRELKQSMSGETKTYNNINLGSTFENIAANLMPDFTNQQKSPISLVYEIAVKINQNVMFDVVSERGPAHMKVFVTECRVGNLVTHGEGSSKKLSKRNAAANMLQNLPLQTFSTVSKKSRSRRAKKYNAENGIPNFNYQQKSPISLVYETAVKHDLKVVFEVVNEMGPAHKKEFVTQCRVGTFLTEGEGSTKKISKNRTAEKMLLQLNTLPTIPDFNNMNNKIKRKRRNTKKKMQKLVNKNILNTDFSNGQINPMSYLKQIQQAMDLNIPTPAIVKQFLNMVTSDTSSTKSDTKFPQTENYEEPKSQVIPSKDQLLDLAKLMGVQVKFSDFPKTNQDIYFTLVSLSTTPPQVCYGEGSTTKIAREKAALEAINFIHKLGLDNVIPKKDQFSIEEFEDEENPEPIKSEMITNQIKK